MTETVWDLFDLSGEVIIVTGGTGQLGSQMCDALAEAGAHVVVVSRTYEDCKQKSEELSQSHNEAMAYAADIRDKESVTDMVRAVNDRFSQVDVLINSAWCGEGHGVPFEELTIDQWQSMTEGVLTQTFICSQAALPYLRESGGRIVNIASHYGLVSPDQRMYGDTGMNNPPNYGAAKAGVIQFTRWLATYVAEDGVRVNTLTPGGFYSERFEENTDYEEVFVPNYRDRTPLGRMGDESDLKGAIVFLASRASKWMTGSNLVIDGGWTAW
jgi:gluconate 5-dehydrogenase